MGWKKKKLKDCKKNESLKARYSQKFEYSPYDCFQ